MTSPFPEPEAPELERFYVYSRLEIAALLRQLRDEGALTTVYFDGEPGFAVTSLLAVNERFGELIFDCVAEPVAQKRLLASQRLVFVAFLDRVKVQFSASVAEVTCLEQRPAFRVPMPEQVLRLQRREYFRVHPPLAKPARCLVPYDKGNQQYEALRVLDLSAGGLAVLAYPGKFDLSVGAVVDECVLELPGVGSINVCMRVRYLEAEPKASQPRRCGCEFIDMTPAARLTLQRYIHLIEAEQRKLAAAKRVA